MVNPASLRRLQRQSNRFFLRAIRVGEFFGASFFCGVRVQILWGLFLRGAYYFEALDLLGGATIPFQRLRVKENFTPDLIVDFFFVKPELGNERAGISYGPGLLVISRPGCLRSLLMVEIHFPHRWLMSRRTSLKKSPHNQYLRNG